jgi:hypothetical protein
MPADAPLSFVIIQIIKHTPLWVWGILALLVVLGSMQMRDHVLTRVRLLLAPIGLGGYSLWGAVAAFGMRAEVFAVWTAGVGLALAANRILKWPRDARPDGAGRFALRGSPWPLVVMLSIFAIRYVGAVTLVFHPDWARGAGFSLAMCVAYGALSGLFTARALRILGTAPVTVSLQAA